MCIMGSPSAPTPPPPVKLPPPVDPGDATIAKTISSRRRQERQLLAMSQGRGSTNKTGGLEGPASALKTVLGA